MVSEALSERANHILGTGIPQTLVGRTRMLHFDAHLVKGIMAKQANEPGAGAPARPTANGARLFSLANRLVNLLN
jgi:hypothetical protein